MNLKKLLQAIFKPLIKLLSKLHGSKNPHQNLAKTCKLLQQQIVAPADHNKAWENYAKSLLLAKQCGGDELNQVIGQFDGAFNDRMLHSNVLGMEVLQALLTKHQQTPQNLETAWRFAQRLPDSSAVVAAHQQICVQIAQLGEGSMLLAKLQKMYGEKLLDPLNLELALEAFLVKSNFDLTLPWTAFFRQMPASDLPRIHQVYHLVDRPEAAAKLAEAKGDQRNALKYWLLIPGKESTLQALNLAQKLRDEPATIQAHRQLAELSWEEGDYADALEHFRKSENLAKVSDCHQKLGQFGLAIQLQPSTDVQWRQELRSTVENAITIYLDHQEFTSAVQLLKTIEEAWQQKSSEPEILTEVERTQRLLAEIVKTARGSLEAEMRDANNSSASQQIAIFKRWSLLEAAAGNYLEAGLQAEKAQDYFAASLLFEKAGAFGQAVCALDAAAPNGAELRKAQLLQQGGDFFMAGLLYEKLQDVDMAISMYEQAKYFDRASDLLQKQLGVADCVFNDRFRDLLAKAGRGEQLAEMCATRAGEEGRSTEEKARLWRRIKELAEQGLVGQKWVDLAAIELPDIESLERDRFEQSVESWVKAASQEILTDYIDAIGLDLGTSNSVVCVYSRQQGKPEVVEHKGQRQIPSVFAIDQLGQELVGIPVLDLLGKSPRAIITRAKREMGTDRKFKVGNQDYRAEEISARIINCARQFAREYLQEKIAIKVSEIAAKNLGSIPPADWIKEFFAIQPPVIPLNDIVITVPAYFNEAQKQATKTAGILADINVLRLIHEPTAACLGQRIQAKNETILIVDLGAGTLDLSIIETGEGVFEVLEIEGDNSLGSADLDEIIYTHFSEFIKTEIGEEVPHNSLAATRLRQACEQLKIELSTHSEWVIDLPYLINDRSIQLSLTRTSLERLAASWLAKIRNTCHKIHSKPQQVLLIGGGGLMPAVRQQIQDVFQIKPDAAYDPLTLVARGAATQAAINLGAVKDVLLLDVTPFSLGIRCQDSSGEFKFDPVIPKHTTIPTTKAQRYTTAADGQIMVEIEIFQGESSIPAENFNIGQFLLKGLTPAPAGAPQIDVTFDIDCDCLLTVTACDAVTGKKQSVTFSDSHLLTPAQAASLQVKFQLSQSQQILLRRLQKLAVDLRDSLSVMNQSDLSSLCTRLQVQIQSYERYRDQYLPTSLDNKVMFEIYSDRNAVAEKAQLALDQWGTLGRSVDIWLDSYQLLDSRSATVENQAQQLAEEGEVLLLRTHDAVANTAEISVIYQRWLNVIENLPVNPTGNPEELAQHFVNLRRYSEALQQFQRIETSLSLSQTELGLEILANLRQRADYKNMFEEYFGLLGIHSPDFAQLNHSVRIYTPSIVWIQVDFGENRFSGSGFAISPNQIATNRHVVIDETTGKAVAPENLQVLTNQGSLPVVSVHLPSWGADDVAILQVETASDALVPLRLGFSELVEVGEKIMTIGFPAPDAGGFQENFYCNTGLVNRIRSSPFCTERVLEVSIPLQGGISGAPILNQFGEVIGLLTFSIDHGGGRSFYSIPVELLRRLRTEL
jgi:molecular chaperone DnaK